MGLVLGYTQAMMAFLLINPEPKDILIVGLGGGSLSKFCREQIPMAKITTIEVNDKVIALRDTFHIPKDDARFQVVHDNAVNYMKQAKAVADVILVDGYNSFGIPPELSTIVFYRDCHAALRDGGILISNISGDAKISRALINRIKSVFSRRALQIKTVIGYNDIVIALKGDRLPDNSLMRSRANRFQTETGFYFSRFLDQIIISSRHWVSDKNA